MITKRDFDDPEALSNFLRRDLPDAAKDSISKAILFGWWLLPQDRRTVDNLERELRRLVDEALQYFRENTDRFLNAEDSLSSSDQIALARNHILKIGQQRFGTPSDDIRALIDAVSEGERLKQLLRTVYNASSWDELLAGDRDETGG